MLDYLSEYGHLSFSDAPLNDVDLLIFSQLAYMDFEDVRPSPCPFSLALAHAAFADSPDASEARFSFQRKDDRRLAQLSASCPRYAGIRFADFRRELNPEAESQFAVLSLLIGEGRLLVSFRGTDNTLAGWKEDFNMAFMDEIPAQRMALAYIEEIAPAADRVILTGHSKGGNLALYAAAACPSALQEKIDLAVSFDGPGLNERLVASAGFRRMEDRMRVVMPCSSLVGLLFEQPKDVRLVDSRIFSILQHYPYFWKTEKMDFIYLSRPSASGALLGGTLRGLLERLDMETREQLVEAVYEIISSTEADTFNDLASRWLQSAAAIATRLSQADAETRRLFLRVISAFLSSAADALSALRSGNGGSASR